MNITSYSEKDYDIGLLERVPWFGQMKTTQRLQMIEADLHDLGLLENEIKKDGVSLEEAVTAYRNSEQKYGTLKEDVLKDIAGKGEEEKANVLKELAECRKNLERAKAIREYRVLPDGKIREANDKVKGLLEKQAEIERVDAGGDNEKQKIAAHSTS